MDLTFGHGERCTTDQTRVNLKSSFQWHNASMDTPNSISVIHISSSQVILKECNNAFSKRSNVPIRKDCVYHLLSLLETPLDHCPLRAELSSYLFPVAAKENPTLLFRKSQSSTHPSSLAFAK